MRVFASLLPIAVFGPATWLALGRYGRAGFARYRVRGEVCSLNALSVPVAWMAATTVIFLVVMNSV